MDKFKKIDRDFLLSDSSVNSYGFRLLTKGYLLDEYKKNPIGYHMHDRKNGVVVKWEDLKVNDDKVMGKPVINLSNVRGQQTLDEVEGGFLNAASVGHIVVLEASDDPKLMLPGQTGPTITKWYNRECSLCDVPANMNALVLYDKDGEEIRLADFILHRFQDDKNKNKNMEKITLTAEQLTKLNLKADADAAVIDTIITELVAKAAKVDQLTADLTTANTAKTTAEKKFNDLVASTADASVTAQLDAAVTAKKITVELKAVLAVQYKSRPDELKTVLTAMKPYDSVVDAIDKKDIDMSGNPELQKLMAKSGKELWASGEIDKMKVMNLDAYKVKYKEAFDEEYTEEK